MLLGRQDVVIIGAGLAGYMVAIGALKLGLKVVLVDTQSETTDRGYSKYVSSKAFIQASKIAAHITESKIFGLNARLHGVDLGLVNDYVDSVCQQIPQEGAETITKLGGQVLTGLPRFLNKHVILVNDVNVESKQFVIATGNVTHIPPIRGLKDMGYLTIENLFQQIRLPRKILFIGSEPQGLALAQALHRLGSEVVIIQNRSQLLHQYDMELSRQLQKNLEQQGIKILTATAVLEVYWQNRRKIMVCENAIEGQFILEGSDIFIASGYAANINDLNLREIGVECAIDGIRVNKRLKTTVRHIYALGDVIRWPFHSIQAVEYQANIVLSNLAFYLPIAMNENQIPSVVYTDPEFAQVGFTEHQAKLAGYRALKVLIFDYKDIDRTITDNAKEGKIKLVVSHRKVIGASILGPEAGETIAHISLMIRTGATLEDIATTIVPHLSYAQVVKRTANTDVSKHLFSARTKALVHWLQKWVYFLQSKVLPKFKKLQLHVKPGIH